MHGFVAEGRPATASVLWSDASGWSNSGMPGLYRRPKFATPQRNAVERLARRSPGFNNYLK